MTELPRGAKRDRRPQSDVAPPHHVRAGCAPGCGSFTASRAVRTAARPDRHGAGGSLVQAPVTRLPGGGRDCLLPSACIGSVGGHRNLHGRLMQADSQHADQHQRGARQLDGRDRLAKEDGAQRYIGERVSAYRWWP